MSSKISLDSAVPTQMMQQPPFESQGSGKKGYPEQDSSSSYGSPSCLSCIWTAIRNFFACICPCFFGRTQEKAPDLEKPTDVQVVPVESPNPDESEEVEVPRESEQSPEEVIAQRKQSPEEVIAQRKRGVSLREERIAWNYMLRYGGRTLDDSRKYTWKEIRSQIKDKDKELSVLLCEKIGIKNIEEIDQVVNVVTVLLDHLIENSDQLSSEEWRCEDYNEKVFGEPASSENPQASDWETLPPIEKNLLGTPCQNNAQIAVDWYPTL